ncbi:hypothetical protein N1030_08705 [Desulfovibrio mangrovi]|uniref:hypothetical protein n=1 Tax=Desulfovibrio mangrovi TaxID=2976983 RepID=UPI0022456623|nr:hypothetical protein [Desulfovibrio mangrovi]UZP69030.1 hypothetical protein N1030_08705 [Desulfovibrio mangrovi]
MQQSKPPPGAGAFLLLRIGFEQLWADSGCKYLLKKAQTGRKRQEVLFCVVCKLPDVLTGVYSLMVWHSVSNESDVWLNVVQC